MQHVTLNSGVEMPVPGFGVFSCALSGSDMARVATLDGGASVFLDHGTSEAGTWLGTHKLGL